MRALPTRRAVDTLRRMGARERWTIVALSATVAAVAACTSFSSGDPPAALPEAGTPDASDATTDAAFPDARSDASAVNLLVNGDFELGCAGWSQSNATLQDQSPGRDGGSACKVCAKSAGVDAFVFQRIMPAVTGRTYVGEAFVSAAFDAGPSTVRSCDLVVESAGPVEVKRANGTAAPLTNEWQRVSVLLKDDVDAGVDLLLQVVGTGCFLVDDARVYVP